MTKFIKILLTSAIFSGLMGCESKPEKPYDVYIKTEEYKENNKPKLESTLEEVDYFDRITFEDESKGYSKEYLVSILDSMGNDKGYIYGAYCHKEEISKQTCVKLKIKVPKVEENKIHKTEIDDIYIFNNNDSLFLHTTNQFNAVYFEDVDNIPNSNLQLPVNLTVSISIKLKNNGSEVLYSKDQSGYGASAYIVK